MSHMGPAKPGEERRYCSFCGAHEAETRVLFVGPAAYICGDCVSLCVNAIMTHQVREPETSAGHEIVSLAPARIDGAGR